MIPYLAILASLAAPALASNYYEFQGDNGKWLTVDQATKELRM